ncbi:MAG: hypothetical protein IKA62_07050 [Clostridia bacterium]|nr:hypothetical protein [Clostridia bacterium]
MNFGKRIINFIFILITFCILIFGADSLARTISNWLNFEYSVFFAFVIFCIPVYWFVRKADEKTKIANSLQNIVNNINIKVIEGGEIVETDNVSKKTIQSFEEEIDNLRNL